jgi:hypothetical protein
VAKQPCQIAENAQCECEYDVGAKVAPVVFIPIHE